MKVFLTILLAQTFLRIKKCVLFCVVKQQPNVAIMGQSMKDYSAYFEIIFLIAAIRMIFLCQDA